MVAGCQARATRPRASSLVVALVAFAASACGSDSDAGKATPDGGGVIFKLPDGGGLLSPNDGSKVATVLPPGFTQADVGGYRLGDPVPADAGALDAGTTSSPGGCGTTLLAVVRDFRSDGVNFEGAIADDRNLVQATLGADLKPVFAQPGPTATTGGPADFDEWYRDVSGVNMPYVLYLWFQPNQVLTFHSTAFFPLDGKGFGNEGRSHNFHFTTEAHTEFLYKGGETFHFTGDDDLWVFVNKKLAIDLGGVHKAETAQIDLDAQAPTLGITKGNVYPLDFFHAERHTTESNFEVETDLSFVNCGTIVPNVH